MEHENINSNSQQIIAALAVLDDGEGSLGIVDFAADSQKAALKEKIEACLLIEPQEREVKLRQQIGAMLASERWSGLAEIHPAWILEELINESPRIIGIILRYLPSRHVRYILENLPPTVRYAIPNIVEAFMVPEPVLNVIKYKFENRFAKLHLSRTIEHFGFEQLFYLKSEELEVLFRDIGLQELAAALHGISGKSIHVLLNRLSLRDAKRLQQRMRSLEGISDVLKRQAKYTVLEVGGEHLGPDRLLLEIGLAAFARAMSSSNDELMKKLCVKLDPQISYVLKRYVDEKKSRNTPDVTQERQTMILSRVAWLAGEKHIDQSWNRFSSAS